MNPVERELARWYRNYHRALRGTRNNKWYAADIANAWRCLKAAQRRYAEARVFHAEVDGVILPPVHVVLADARRAA